MPFSFIEIEEKKSRIIAFIFLSIVLFYFLTAVLLLFVVEYSFIGYFTEGQAGRIFLPPLKHIIIALIAAFLAALTHWSVSTSRLIEKLSLAVGAMPVDPKDTYHQYFKNIVDEVSVAVAGRLIEPLVVASSGMNAFSLQDFAGRSVIGITEGLLAKLNRAQIEAVVGHEAAHVVSGDSLVATVISSLAELYEESIEAIRRALSKTRGRGSLALFLIFVILSFMNFLSKILRSFLSRQREYRADAVAVRLTRNPLSLAEALKLISTGWRGAGMQGERMESIFIVNPRLSRLDEGEGLLSDIFSTHPPVKKRVGVLLGMAHLDEKTLQENLKNFRRVSPVALSEFKPDDFAKAKRWFIFDGQNWLGSYSLEEMKKIENFRPDQWVRLEGLNAVMPAYHDDDLRDLFLKSGEPEKNRCPHCHSPLEEINYEGAPILKCSFCGGILIKEYNVSRILIRRDKVFSQETERMAQAIIASKRSFMLKNSGAKTVWVIDCPQCKRKMRRQFFVYSYPVEIDRCANCNSAWFDRHELELLQYIYEHKEKFFF